MERNTSEEIDLHTLAENARALVHATAEVAGEKVADARKRLSAALESSGEMLGRAKEKAIEGAKYTDKAVRANPYQAIAVAAVVGALAGFMIARSTSRKD